MTVAGLFVTGTDTGVGKTTVGAALLRLAVRAGLRAIPYKPVETGCAPEPADATLLWEAAGRPIPLSSVCPYALPLPAAPALAAPAAAVTLDLADLAARAEDLAAQADFLLVEGAGGLLAPYTADATGADLAGRLGLPVLVVARTALGTLNHTALTLAELRRRELPIAGVLLVRSTPTPEPHDCGNVSLLARLTGTHPLAVVPYLPAPALRDPDQLASALEAALPRAALSALLRGQPAEASRPFG